MTVAQRAAHLAELAQRWQDPDDESRRTAVQVTLELSGRYTEEGLAFALNHRIYQFASSEFQQWIGSGESVIGDSVVGISFSLLDPLAGLPAVVASLVLGHRVVVATPPLVSAFSQELAESLDADIYAASRQTLFGEADAWIVGCHPEEAEGIRQEASEAGIVAPRVLLQEVGDSAIVLSGREDQAALSGLAEDLLLHDGLAPGTPRIVWAPGGTAPDLLLNALAGFREFYPAHAATDGSLAMPTAFLVAAGQSHATGPGFLVSLGEPEPQAPAHIRWAEYDQLDTVRDWALAEGASLAFVVAESDLAERLTLPVPIRAPGDAHRAPLDPAVPAFLRSL